jgi:DNA-binding NarL/FixJ family response regulator
VSPIRILVADDHEVVRRGLRALLEAHPELQVCAEAANGREAVEKAKQCKPNLVVMDIGMPELNGLEATRRILRALPQTEVLILTMHESEQVVREVLEAGARGYVLKSDAARDLVTAVKTLQQHKPFFTSRVAELVLKGYLGGVQADRAEPSLPSLTPREREIVQLLAEGKSNKEVAAALEISVKTVEAHRANIMRKLNLHSISELVHYAIRNKIVEP